METLQDKIDALIETAGDKTTVENLGVIKNEIGLLEQAKTKAETDYKELLRDYAQAIKSSAYKVDETKVNASTSSTTQSFEDFCKEYNFKNSK